MNRVEKILGKVRSELADLDKSRWSDVSLLGLLSDAQEDIIYKTQCLYRSITISTMPNKNTYILPDDFRLLKSVSYDNRELEIVTRSYIEKLGSNWVTSVGTPSYVVYDGINRGSIKIIPIPETPADLDITYLANPLPILSMTDELSIGTNYDLGLFYYVVARALSRDFDAQDVNIGSRYMLLYDKEIKRFLAESSKGFLATPKPFISEYRGFI